MSETELSRSDLSPRREAPTPILSPESSKARPASVTIGLPPNEVFAFVRDFTNFSKFMRGCSHVDVIGADRARLSFDHGGSKATSEITRTAEIANTMITWKAVESSSLDLSGALSLEPAPGARGTVVSLRLQFDGEVQGKVKGMLSYFTGQDPKNEAYINLRRLKAYLETGEVPTIQGQPSGRDQ